MVAISKKAFLFDMAVSWMMSASKQVPMICLQLYQSTYAQIFFESCLGAPVLRSTNVYQLEKCIIEGTTTVLVSVSVIPTAWNMNLVMQTCIWDLNSTLYSFLFEMCYIITR